MVAASKTASPASGRRGGGQISRNQNSRRLFPTPEGGAVSFSPRFIPWHSTRLLRQPGEKRSPFGRGLTGHGPSVFLSEGAQRNGRGGRGQAPLSGHYEDHIGEVDGRKASRFLSGIQAGNVHLHTLQRGTELHRPGGRHLSEMPMGSEKRSPGCHPGRGTEELTFSPW